jgi:hypothetical protein
VCTVFASYSHIYTLSQHPPLSHWDQAPR